VIKTNHDSGSVYVIRNKSELTEDKVTAIRNSLEKKFGVRTGEWAYNHIDPKAFVEEYLESNGTGLADYKFHCNNGKVLWKQYIYDRGEETKEVIVDRDGMVMEGHHFDQNMIHMETFTRPESWYEMVRIAEILSSEFKYVRIDLYLVKDNIYLGEMTFYPLSGTYTTETQKVLGEQLIIN
jgi:hypothetical protein